MYNGDVASQSDILEFKYEDASKLDKYGDNVPELEKDTEWHFGNDYSFLSEETQKTPRGESIIPERKIKSVDEEGKPNEYEDNTEFSLADFGDIPIGESFIPNFPMSLFDVSGYDDPIAKYVASVTATNAGNYGVLYEYTVNIVNIGTAKKIQYTMGTIDNRGYSVELVNNGTASGALVTQYTNSDGSVTFEVNLEGNQEHTLKVQVQNYASYGGWQTNQFKILKED